MTDEKIYIGTVGLAINLNTGMNLTEATKVSIKVMTPDGKKREWVGSVSQADNMIITYITQIGDLVKDGIYKLQAYVEISAFKGLGETVELTVNKEFL